MGVRKGTVVLFVPTLFGCFLGIPFLYVFAFKMFFVTCFSCFFGEDGDTHCLSDVCGRP